MRSNSDNEPISFVVNAQQIGEYYGAGSPLPSAGPARVNEIFAAGGCLSQSLYEGIDNYKSIKDSKIDEYHRLAGESPYILPDPKETYLRRRFAQLLAEQSAIVKESSKDLQTKQNDPDSATITMQKLLGDNGYRLYELALEEERYSTAYMDAVLNRSTREHVGEKWGERFILLVGGPSSSGKTYASSEVVKVCTPLLKKDKSVGSATNYDISVDGGNFREMSQMRKLVIKLAVDKGYTGVQDLQKASEQILDAAKMQLQEYVLDPQNKHSVVIPETFSGVVGLDKKFFDKIDACPNAKVVFSKVTGKNKEIFQDVVKFMGSRRAWKTDWDVKISADINSAKGLPESKAYGAGGFVFGKMGTSRAKEKAGQDVIVFENDLVLKKEEPINSNNWVDAKSKETGNIIKVSERVFNLWVKNNQPGSLKDFADKTRLPPIMRLSKVSKEFISDNFPNLPALKELHQACELNRGKKIEYALGRFIMTMLGDQSATAAWRAELQNACKHLQDYKQGNIKRDQLSVVLESCGSIGAMLNNSKVIDKVSGKVVDAIILNAMAALNNEVKIELDNRTTQTVTQAASVSPSTPLMPTSMPAQSTAGVMASLSMSVTPVVQSPGSVSPITTTATPLVPTITSTVTTTTAPEKTRARAKGTAARTGMFFRQDNSNSSNTAPSNSTPSNTMMDRFRDDENDGPKVKKKPSS